MKVFRYAINDMRRQKVKTTFGILGIAISILILTVVGCLSDSLSYSMLDQATIEVGAADIVFSKETAQDLNFNAYFDQNIIENKLKDSNDDIENFFPRIRTIIPFYHVDPSLDNISVKKTLFMYGINTQLEHESGNMGNFWICEDEVRNEEGKLTYEIKNIKFQGPIQDGYCIVTQGAAKLFNLKIGDKLTAKFTDNEEELIVAAIVDPDLKFNRMESSLIITELSWMQTFIHQEGKVNFVYSTLKNPELIYDTRSIHKTTIRLREIATAIQKDIGFEYVVSMPKLEQLDQSGQQSMMMDMTFYFILFFSMLITGILINSILSTSVEERISEFGTLRVFGAKSRFIFKLVVISGIIMAIVGTTIGTLIGALLGPPVLEWVFGNIDILGLQQGSINFIILPITILRSLLIGLVVTTGVSFFPAYRANSTIITDAIDPSRRAKKSNRYKLVKEGSAQFKLMGIGLGIAAVGIFIFLILPRILTSSGGPNLTNYILIGLLLMVLIGLVFIALGIVPVVENIIAFFLKPFIKKYFPIYKLNLIRYRRRNTGNLLMFALTFAFIFFISSMLEMQTANNAVMFEFQYGSDLVLSNTGTLEGENAVNRELLDQLKDLPGISQVAPLNHNGFDVAMFMSLIFRIGEEGFDSLNFEALLGTIPKFDTEIGDIGGYMNFPCTLLGIDENYYSVINHDLLMWDRTTGSSADAIKEVMNSKNKCIIAKIFADHLGITELPAKIKLVTEGEDSVENITILDVVGVSEGMPGFYNMRSSEMSLYQDAGVLVNLEDYSRIMGYCGSDPKEDDFIIDKIFLNMIDPSVSNLKDLQAYINNAFGQDYSFNIDEAVSKIKMMEENSRTSNMIIQTILFFSIVVCLFGLLSAMYSTMLERMYELGILRAMGMKPHEIRYLLMAEALTAMLAAGSLGAITGWFISYLTMTNISIITEVPVITAVNVGTLLSTFLTSIGICVVGMFVITRKVEKMNIIDVLRATF